MYSWFTGVTTDENQVIGLSDHCMIEVKFIMQIIVKNFNKGT